MRGDQKCAHKPQKTFIYTSVDGANGFAWRPSLQRLELDDIAVGRNLHKNRQRQNTFCGASQLTTKTHLLLAPFFEIVPVDVGRHANVWLASSRFGCQRADDVLAGLVGTLLHLLRRTLGIEAIVCVSVVSRVIKSRPRRVCTYMPMNAAANAVDTPEISPS
jgi:hypothetical protein